MGTGIERSRVSGARRRGAAYAVAAGSVAALFVAPAAVAAEPLRVPGRDGAVLDWSAGQLIARGLGVADRHAPSPAVARDAARSRAIADATRALIVAAKAVPMASGQRAGEVLTEAQLAAAAAQATVVSSDPLVDGSWRLELALPLEALRLAAAGPRAAPAGDDAGPAVLIVRAPADTTPAVGVAIGDGKTTVRGATLWARGTTSGIPLPAEALKRATQVEVRKRGTGGAGALRVPRLDDATDATLFVVVLGE